MHHVQLFVRATMQTPWCLGVMGFLLVFVPILGMWAVHKYGWEHWEPFGKKHVSGGAPAEEEWWVCRTLEGVESLSAKKALGAPDARRDWCKCCDEFSKMITEECQNNPRYRDGPRMFWNNEPPPPPPWRYQWPRLECDLFDPTTLSGGFLCRQLYTRYWRERISWARWHPRVVRVVTTFAWYP